MIKGSSLILCVEDDVDTQEMLGMVIQERGYGFEAVGTVAEALRAVHEKNISLLLLDNLLPDGTGIDVCRHVRQMNQRLPIIFLSGSTFEDEAIRAMQSGANVFLTKPIVLDKLYTMLANYAPLMND